VTWDGDLETAFAPMSVTLTLDDEIDVSRGDVLAVDPPPMAGQRFEAEVVWMDERPAAPGRVYLLKQGARTVGAEVDHPLVLNQIGRVQVATSRPLVFDRYGESRGTGNFVLIDPATQFTCGAGMITDPVQGAADRPARLGIADRLARLARQAGSDEEAAEAIREALEEILT
jgi:sulfate adenylyltransferase subunit 1 (EFTu-like GTPase family)